MTTSHINLADLDGSNGFRLDGVTDGESLSFSVSNAGDVNGDGIDDLIIGASGAYSNSASGSGSSYIVFGKVSGFEAEISLDNLDSTEGFRLDGLVGRSYLGHSVSAAGDVDGDGFDDLIIGVPGFYGASSEVGLSYVVFGKASGFDATINLMTLNGAMEKGHSGYTVSGAGDINGDGFDDLMVGAPGSREGDYYSGYTRTSSSSYIIFGSSDFTGLAAYLRHKC